MDTIQKIVLNRIVEDFKEALPETPVNQFINTCSVAFEQETETVHSIYSMQQIAENLLISCTLRWHLGSPPITA